MWNKIEVCFFLLFQNNSSNVCQQLFRSTYNSVTISSILLAPSLSSSPTLFPKFWLSFLDCGNKHVSSSSSWHSVEATLDTADSDHKQILGTYKCIRKILLKNVKLEETICILTFVSVYQHLYFSNFSKHFSFFIFKKMYLIHLTKLSLDYIT